MSPSPITGAPMVPRSSISFFSFMMARAKYLMNCLWLGILLSEALVEGLVLVLDPALLAGPALAGAVQPQGLATEVDHKCLFDILVLGIALWRCDGGLGGELAVIGSLRSIASLWVFGRRVRSIGTHFEVSSLSRSFPSSPSLSPTLFSLSVLPSHLSGSIPSDFRLGLGIS